MKLVAALIVLFLLYQISAIQPVLKWVVILIILGLFLRFSKEIFSDLNKIGV